MTSAAMMPYRSWALPWDRDVEQDGRFRRLLVTVIPAIAVGAFVVALLPLAQPLPAPPPSADERLARLLLERVEPPPPPPPPVVRPEPQRPVEERIVEATPKPVPQPPVVRERAPESVPEPVPEIVEPPPQVVQVPEPPPVDRTREARDEALAAGLMPLADELASLRDNSALGAATAAQARIGSVGDAPRSERALLTTASASSASAGVDAADLSRDTGGSGLAGRETTQVVGTIAGLSPEQMAAARARRTADDGVAARSREEIELVFDANKGAIYALYDRALRSDPTLQGKLVLELVIEPSGEVSQVEIVSSELGDDELERRLVQRVGLFRFEARDVARVVTTKPIDFFPA